MLVKRLLLFVIALVLGAGVTWLIIRFVLGHQRGQIRSLYFGLTSFFLALSSASGSTSSWAQGCCRSKLAGRETQVFVPVISDLPNLVKVFLCPGGESVPL